MRPIGAPTGAPQDGPGIRRASWAGTALFVATALAADLSPSTFEPVALVVAGGLFAAGCAIFLWAFLVMAGRSRTNLLELAQVWFLAGPPTPSAVRRSLLGAFAVEVVAALVTAGARPYTSLAAGVLVPMYGLALCGLWGALHGAFPVRHSEGRDAGGLRSGDVDH